MKTTSKLGILAILLGSLTVAGVVSASPSGDRDDRAAAAKAFDTNKDGKLDDTERAAFKASREAAHAARKAQMIATYDTNKDGKLDDQERAVMQAARIAERFKALDKDGNGSISLDEFKAGAPMGRGGHGKHHGHHGHHGRGQGQGQGHDHGGGMDDDGGADGGM
jgi:Ca2+-binding EF-hand superfamily protein